MNPKMWMLVWASGREERFWGTITVEGPFIRLVHYTGGVAGFPRPSSERVVRIEALRGWSSDL
jgi:hypothetical protein